MIESIGVETGPCHLNEGHAAFVVLERARGAMARHKLSFREALAATRAGNVFTTHTSVAAAFDEFSPQALAKCFPDGGRYLASLGISFQSCWRSAVLPAPAPRSRFVQPISPFEGPLGSTRSARCTLRRAASCYAPFSTLAAGGSSDRPRDQRRPCSILGSPATDELWTNVCGRERWRGSAEGLEEVIAAVDDRTLWAVRGTARADLVRHARARLAHQTARRGGSADAINLASRVLDPDVLTLGFARRFAEYKRPNLLLRNEEALRRLLSDQRRPVQLLVAGKAHPADSEGKALVEAWIRFAAGADVRARCVFLEDYDLTVAKELVHGVDVWINTPRRPWEACGTSGMKVLVNGGLNLSVLDGWWAEAFDPDVGWAIGEPGQASDDGRDVAALFRIVEQEIVPAFYARDADGLPRAWLHRVRASLSRLTPRFSANRMLREYVAGYYGPADVEIAHVLRMAPRSPAISRPVPSDSHAAGRGFGSASWMLNPRMRAGRYRSKSFSTTFPRTTLSWSCTPNQRIPTRTPIERSWSRPGRFPAPFTASSFGRSRRASAPSVTGHLGHIRLRASAAFLRNSADHLASLSPAKPAHSA